MTALDFMLSRTASRDWKAGDRILVSRLDHDGGVAPWIEVAADRGFEVDWIDVGLVCELVQSALQCKDARCLTGCAHWARRSQIQPNELVRNLDVRTRIQHA